VGTGISVVTLCYLHRFLKVLDELLTHSALQSVLVSNELVLLFDDVAAIFRSHG
jgi:hypothetical protein